LTYAEADEEVFLGRSVTQHKHVSDETARKIDIEIRKIVDASHDVAKNLVLTHRDKLELMTDALMKYETIDTAQIDQIMEGKVPDPPKGWEDSGSDDNKSNKSDSVDDSADSTSIGGTAEQL